MIVFIDNRKLIDDPEKHLNNLTVTMTDPLSLDALEEASALHVGLTRTLIGRDFHTRLISVDHYAKKAGRVIPNGLEDWMVHDIIEHGETILVLCQPSNFFITPVRFKQRLETLIAIVDKLRIHEIYPTDEQNEYTLSKEGVNYEYLRALIEFA